MKNPRTHKFICLFIGVFVYLLIPRPSAAAGEFQADYDVQYAVSPSAITIVTQRITLTNRQTNLYPKQYSILIDSKKISNVLAYDGGGIIRPVIQDVDGKTQITLSFNEQIVGQGKKLSFSLRYENADIAQMNGSIAEITIPGIVDDPDIASYTVSLQVPQTFGPAAYMSPPPSDGRRWSKEQMIKGGVTAAYGKEQVYTVDLSYYLENSTVTAKNGEIALPPNTAYQTVDISEISPAPSSVVRDEDGNWLARYTLTPGARMDIGVKATVTITLEPRADYPRERIESPYTQATAYWQTSDPEIARLAKTYNTPRAIYDYVVNTLSYDYERVKNNPVRRGASDALANPKQAICMEFTDLFIALARAAGIAARENVGYAYTTNSKLRPLSLVSDVLHAWPEYYDPDQKLWIPVDPTWADTTGGVNYFDKLDFNHIVFAIHGKSSEYPYPAGFYRRSTKQGKDVLVSFSDKPASTPIAASLSTKIEFPSIATGGLVTNGLVTVRNTSGREASLVQIAVKAEPVSFFLERAETRIPPYAAIEIPITIRIDDILKRGTGTISVSVNGDLTVQRFSIQPMYWLFATAMSVLTLVVLLVIILALRSARPWHTHAKP